MTQTYRTDDFARWGAGQGFNLSPQQVDINFWDLTQRMLAQEAKPPPAAAIAYFEISGVMMYVHMTDGTVLGPYELPVAIFRDRGVWTTSTVYSKMDTFSINGGLYVVIFDHTSGTTFNPGANDGAGHDYYQLMLQTPGSSLPAGGAVGMALLKATTTDYSTLWGMPDASMVTFTPATDSTLTSFNVADALEEVSGGGGDAANISYNPTDSGLVATNVQDALDELSANKAVGVQTIWVPASAMTPRINSGPAIGKFEMPTNNNLVNTLDFDPTTSEYAQFDIAMPRSWDSSIEVWGNVFWSHSTITTGGATAVFILEAVSITPSAGTLDVAFDGRRAILAGGTANRLYSGETDVFLILNSSGAPALYGDLVSFRMWREAANFSDNLVIDARLHGVQIFYTTNAATDDA